MAIKSKTIQSGRIAIIELKGSLVGDRDTDTLRDTVADFIEQGNKCLVIDLQRVNYMNSSGIGALIAAHASYARNAGQVRLVGISKNVQNLFVITKLIDTFEVFDSMDDAIQSFVSTKSTT
ncbi:MAG: STAS domain-containing protein [Ignavibacteriae bacterium]|nr:STAS domain-containing protein [Ignavibacteria bacterium]MBI3365871.1 STAS domain-containing protein [Ignavibacteriota bacterium]